MRMARCRSGCSIGVNQKRSRRQGAVCDTGAAAIGGAAITACELVP